MKKTYNFLVSIVSIAFIIAAIAIIANTVGSGSKSSSLTNNSIASLALTAPLSGTFDAGQTQKVSWTSTNYVPSTVQVALIRKVSDNPATYELVRLVAPAKTNSGRATWVPAPTDLGSGLSIQVGCALSSQACTASNPTSQLAVINDGRFANTANVFQAIEQLNNK